MVNVLDATPTRNSERAKDNDMFYLCPLPKKPAEPGKLWYTSTPVCQNSMMKEICKEAELDSTFTNHSLRAYGATKMFQAKVPERLMQ